MEEENKNTSIVKREPTNLARLGKTLEITKKLLALNDEPFLIPFRKGDKWGFCDRDKKIVIPCVYDFTDNYSEGLARVIKNNKCGFVDKRGNEMISCRYDYYYPFEGKNQQFPNHIFRYFNSGIIWILKRDKFGYDDKFGCINKMGEEVIPFIYENAFDFSEGLSSVRLKDKYGYINKDGDVVIPFLYDNFTEKFHEGLARVIKNDKCGFIDKKGNEIIPCIYDGLGYFSEGLLWVQKNNKWGCFDKMGNVALPFIYKYDKVCEFKEGMAGVQLNGKYGFIDKYGNEVIPLVYDYTEEFSEGLACVGKNNKWGYIDKFGNEIIPNIFDYAYNFSEGLACIKENNFPIIKYGFINIRGKLIIPYYLNIVNHYFENGFLFISVKHYDSSKAIGYIDKKRNGILGRLKGLSNK